jgi:hypothetical protein
MKSMIRVASATASQQILVRLALLGLGIAAVLLPQSGRANDFCPDIYDGGAFPLNFNPAFTHVERFNFGSTAYDGLVVTSFFNAVKNPDPDANSTTSFYERDLVARITGIGYRSPAWWNPNQAEILTDLDLADPVTPNAPGQQVWPNEAQRVPDGVLPFEAIVSPQGFHPTPSPGRLTLINLDAPTRTEYLIDQSRQEGGPCKLDPSDPKYSEGQQPRFYHLVRWVDMDSDGLKDAVSVRSTFKVQGAFCLAPGGELVWFKNPGAGIDPNTAWVENVITDFPLSVTGPDIALDVADLEGDGVPEIIATNFFTGEAITLYGAPVGDSDWSGVNTATNPPRIAPLSTGQGRPFSVAFVDLNRDGKLDALATNHQSAGCYPRTQDPIPGRVYALEQPASGDIFNDPWVTHILKDDIRPNPTYPAPNNDPAGPGRLAPGLAQEFWPTPWKEQTEKPWILVGGDEAAKVWLLKPDSQDASDWSYGSAVIFDINDTYGANTSQSFSAPPPATGVSISTIGGVSWRYDRDWAWGAYAEIYIPVFEGRDIYRINFRPRSADKKIVCPADGALACPAP